MIAAVILAAGQSQRMGRPKLNLPWGETTVIGQVVNVLGKSGVEELVVVTGGAQAAVQEALRGQLQEGPYKDKLRLVYNELFERQEMLTSFQCGLRALGDPITAALVCLGDQPQIEPSVVEGLLDAYRHTSAALIVPSYRMRRGHPWLLGRAFWREVLALGPQDSLRDFLNRHQRDINYLEVDTESVLMDLDTPADYRAARPESDG